MCLVSRYASVQIIQSEDRLNVPNAKQRGFHGYKCCSLVGFDGCKRCSLAEHLPSRRDAVYNVYRLWALRDAPVPLLIPHLVGA